MYSVKGFRSIKCAHIDRSIMVIVVTTHFFQNSGAHIGRVVWFESKLHVASKELVTIAVNNDNINQLT